LYQPLTEGERVKIARLLVTGEKHFKGDAKGCGLNIDKLQVGRLVSFKKACVRIVAS
jgi:hypothetical protein